ncbi:MAG: nucleotidyltransferase family protein [Bryobacterales bacterium]|nr:nucleotidyltransferase family protein [Bryobacterales bacterium]
MNLHETVTNINALEPQLRACGVLRLRLFGSVLREEAGPESDIDLLIEFRPGAKNYRQFFNVAEMLEAKLGRRVELVTPESLSPFIGPRILAEAQDVFRAA